MSSLWTDTVLKPKFECLNGDTKTDVLIIGGGLAGILCAYTLEKENIDYILIEAKEICSGITKNTTAKITAEHGIIYDKIIKKYGVAAAKKYYTANSSAVLQYRDLCKKLRVDFDRKDAYVYSVNNRDQILKDMKAYRTIGANVKFTTDTPLPFAVAGAIRLEDQGQFHPLKFLYRLSENLNIKENTKLLGLSKNLAETDKGNINFKKAIIATHFPFLNKHGAYFLKMYQHRSYVIALENAADVSGMYVDADIKGLSFRNFDNLLLLGGGSHRTGKKGGSYDELISFAKEHYPKALIKYKFATQDCMTLDGMPYIGQYSNNTPNLFVATGFNKWGFTQALVAAEMLRDMIIGKANEYSKLFSPSRSILHPQLVLNGVETAVNLLTPTAPRCPHLGCALKYNRQEHSWDCPCHGSRFSENGSLIDGPATDDKKF